jgi:DNA primase
VVNVERQALKLAIQRPALCGPAFDELPSTIFTVPAHAAVCELIAEVGGVASARSVREWAERLRTAAPNDNARSFVTRLAVEPLEVAGPTGEADAKFAEAVLARVEELSVSRQIASIKSRLQRLSPVAEQADYNRMFGDLVAFEQRRKVLSDRAAGAL